MKQGFIILGCVWVLWLNTVAVTCQGQRCSDGHPTVGQQRGWNVYQFFETQQQCEEAMGAILDSSIQRAQGRTPDAQGRIRTTEDNPSCLPVGLLPWHARN